jgi:peroxiredoxin
MPKTSSTSTTRNVLRELTIIACTVALTYGAILLWQWTDQSSEGGRIVVGTPLPETSLHWLDSPDTWSPQDLEGRPAVLQYWSTTCGICRRELPALQRLHEESNGRFNVLTVTSDAPETVTRFFTKEDLRLPVLLDHNRHFARWLKVEVIPTTLIVDGQGNVVHDFEGAPFIGLLRERLIGLAAQVH